jgi:hypothetical protein
MFTTTVSIGKRVTVKTLHDAHGRSAKNLASQGVEEAITRRARTNTAKKIEEEKHGNNVLNMPPKSAANEEEKSVAYPSS